MVKEFFAGKAESLGKTRSPLMITELWEVYRFLLKEPAAPIAISEKDNTGRTRPIQRSFLAFLHSDLFYDVHDMCLFTLRCNYPESYKWVFNDKEWGSWGVGVVNEPIRIIKDMRLLPELQAGGDSGRLLSNGDDPEPGKMCPCDIYRIDIVGVRSFNVLETVAQIYCGASVI